VADSIASPVLWVGFTAFILALLVLDLGVFHRKPHAIGLKEAALWTAGWFSLAVLFNAGVYSFAGSDRGLEFTAGYLVELALSIDNMFVFALIFAAFAVPTAYQHRVLFWGILGALVLRLIFILVGSALLSSFHWIIYVFGGFLVLTGIRILREGDTHPDPTQNRVLRLFRRFIPMTDDYHGQSFSVVKAGKRLATPLLAVLVLVEATDVVFAIDSVPAIFAITDDPFIVYTSNVFAILGLRSLYFLLAGIMDKFTYLKVGLGAVLVFVGGKMALTDIYKVPIAASLAVIVLLIGGSILISLLHAAREERSLAEQERVLGPMHTVSPHEHRPAAQRGQPLIVDHVPPAD
jgi:tellurite resistance protein TerC